MKCFDHTKTQSSGSPLVIGLKRRQGRAVLSNQDGQVPTTNCSTKNGSIILNAALPH